MIFLNVLDVNDQLLEAELDGFAYHLGLSWNEAGQLWTLSIRDLDKQLLISGIRIVPLYPLLQQVRRPELPPGEIVVDCASGYELKRDSFARGDAALWYVDTIDLAELADAAV